MWSPPVHFVVFLLGVWGNYGQHNQGLSSLMNLMVTFKLRENSSDSSVLPLYIYIPKAFWIAELYSYPNLFRHQLLT